MDPSDFIKEALNAAGAAIPQERARALGAPDGFFPILGMFTSALREMNVEGYEPVDNPDFLKKGKR